MSEQLPLEATPSPAFFDSAATPAPQRTSSSAAGNWCSRRARARCNAREKHVSEMPNLMGWSVPAAIAEMVRLGPLLELVSPECHVINGQHHAVGKAQSKGKRKRSRRAVPTGGLKLHGEQPLIGILAAELLLGHEAELLALDDLTVHHPIAMGFADRGRTAQQAGARLCFLRQARTCLSRCDKQEAREKVRVIASESPGKTKLSVRLISKPVPWRARPAFAP